VTHPSYLPINDIIDALYCVILQLIYCFETALCDNVAVKEGFCLSLSESLRKNMLNLSSLKWLKFKPLKLKLRYYYVSINQMFIFMLVHSALTIVNTYNTLVNVEININ